MLTCFPSRLCSMSLHGRDIWRKHQFGSRVFMSILWFKDEFCFTSCEALKHLQICSFSCWHWKYSECWHMYFVWLTKKWVEMSCFILLNQLRKSLQKESAFKINSERKVVWITLIMPPHRAYGKNASARNTNTAPPVPDQEVSNANFGTPFNFWLRVWPTRTTNKFQFLQMLVVDQWQPGFVILLGWIKLSS